MLLQKERLCNIVLSGLQHCAGQLDRSTRTSQLQLLRAIFYYVSWLQKILRLNGFEWLPDTRAAILGTFQETPSLLFEVCVSHPTYAPCKFSAFICLAVVTWSAKITRTVSICDCTYYRFLNGSSVTQFEVCKSDVEVFERLEDFNVTALTLASDSCSDTAIPTSVRIANASYSLCVLTGKICST